MSDALAPENQEAQKTPEPSVNLEEAKVEAEVELAVAKDALENALQENANVEAKYEEAKAEVKKAEAEVEVAKTTEDTEDDVKAEEALVEAKAQEEDASFNFTKEQKLREEVARRAKALAAADAAIAQQDAETAELISLAKILATRMVDVLRGARLDALTIVTVILDAMAFSAHMKYTVNGKRVLLTGRYKKFIVMKGLHLLVEKSDLPEAEKTRLHNSIDGPLSIVIDGYVRASKMGKHAFGEDSGFLGCFGC